MNDHDTYMNRLWATPILALFIGVGIAAVGFVIVLLRDQVLAGTVVTFVMGGAAVACGGGGLIFCGALGFAAYRRINAPPAIRLDRMQPPAQMYLPQYDPPPPMLPAAAEGTWQSAGFPSYDLAQQGEAWKQ